MIKPTCPKDRIILALDVETLEEVENLVNELKDYVGYFKIGLPLIKLVHQVIGMCYLNHWHHT